MPAVSRQQYRMCFLQKLEIGYCIPNDRCSRLFNKRLKESSEARCLTHCLQKAGGQPAVIEQVPDSEQPS
ncbi:hypothetical protein AK812_SmicGene28254 [Symbiodinium microadriaticum]|uniref:Uncharacterized protein n=1 Tax=Symbiodinium microadriaticum TaxID=2951 RepID=A0A1Q9D4W3_SYMMI|nr:hypothetical protein AK812_SmicGene28254 [Symbiodinium microadriaticum]